MAANPDSPDPKLTDPDTHATGSGGGSRTPAQQVPLTTKPKVCPSPFIPVFISHSSHTQADQTAVVRLARAMERFDLIPLLDKTQLSGGEDWRAWISDNLLGSRAGVLLLSKKALNSPRVRREASFMEHVNRARKEYVFLPVVMPEVDDLNEAIDSSDASAEWKSIDLTDTQFIHGTSDPETLAASIYEELWRRGLCPHLSPIEILSDQVGSMLHEASPMSLDGIVSELRTSSNYCLLDGAQQRAGAALTSATVISRRLSRSLRALDRLGARFPPDRRSDVIESISPLVFQVDAAVPLKAPDEWAYHLVADNANLVSSKLILLADLSCLPPNSISVQNLLGTADGVREEIRREALNEMLPDERDRRLGRLDDWINRSYGYIIMNGRLDIKELDALRIYYPVPKMIMVIPHSSAPNESGTVLRPTISLVDERMLVDDYHDVRDELNRNMR